MFALLLRQALRTLLSVSVLFAANLFVAGVRADPTDSPPPQVTDSATSHNDHPDAGDRRNSHSGAGVGVGISVDPAFVLRKALDLFNSEPAPPALSSLPAASSDDLERRALVSLPQVNGRRPGSGVPAAAELRYGVDEVIVEVAPAITPEALAVLENRHRLTRRGGFASRLSGTDYLLYRITDGRSVGAAVRELEADPAVLSAQPNYRFALQDQPKTTGGDPLQYASAKLELPQAHRLEKGGHVVVGIIDSGVDASHPEVRGSIAGTFDATGTGGVPHGHGTAIAALIAAHGRLEGAAPEARLLCVRAFEDAGNAAEGTTFSILKGLDWLAVHAARVINMSFAGPSDPALHRGLESAHDNGIVLVGAAGNAGPHSPPLFPAADANVIAVTATDADNRIYDASNRGAYVALGAPGVNVLVASPDGRYDISSGTSFAAAEVSGIAALVVAQKPALGPDGVRNVLVATAKPLFPRIPSDGFAPRLADAFRAVTGDQTAAAPREPHRKR